MIFFHPDYTVGTGIPPVQPLPLNRERVRGLSTAGRESHPAPKILCLIIQLLSGQTGKSQESKYTTTRE
jgi:hypothetical protein